MNARHADANPIFVAARSAAPGYIRLMLAALAVSILLAAASPSPATAQSTRVTALPASDVLSLRVVGDTIAAGMDTSVFVSTNGGLTWRGSSRPSSAASGIGTVLVHNRRLFAGTFGSGVFVSDDLGTTWRAFNEGLVGGSFDSQLNVSDLEIRRDSLYVSTEGDGVFVRRLSGTDTWHPFGDAFVLNQAASVIDLATDGVRLIACAGDNGTTFRRDPADADWTVSFLGNTGLQPGLSAQSAFFTGGRWVVGTVNGVFLSTKGQEPWTPSSTPLPASRGIRFAQSGPTLFAAVVVQKTSSLIEESHDGGTTWVLDEQVNSLAHDLAVHASDLFTARSDGLFVRSLATASVGGDPLGGSLHFSLAGTQPVRDEARFRFTLAGGAVARLEMFDVTGRRVTPPIEEAFPAGAHELTLDAHGLAPGVYNALLTSGVERGALRVIHVR